MHNIVVVFANALYIVNKIGIASTFSQHAALICHFFSEKDAKWVRMVGIAHIVITSLGQEGN